MNRALGYVRVSTLKQLDNESFVRQSESIIKHCSNNNLLLSCIYFDVGCRDTINDNAAELINQLKDCDVVVCESTDRIGLLSKILAKNKNITIIYTSEFAYNKVDIVSRDETPSIKVIDLELLSTKENRERILDGIRRSKTHGTKFGRPVKDFDRKMAVQLREEGWTLREIGSALGVSHVTISRCVNLVEPLCEIK